MTQRLMSGLFAVFVFILLFSRLFSHGEESSVLFCEVNKVLNRNKLVVVHL